MTDCISNNKEIKNNQGKYDRGSCKENKIIIGPIREKPFCVNYELVKLITSKKGLK